MPTDANLESAGQDAEQEGTLPAQSSDSASASPDETSGNTPETETTEAPEGEGEQPQSKDGGDKKAESFEDKLERLAQSKKDKELKPLRDQLGAQTARLRELESLVVDKALDSLFEEESASLGEDEANKRNARRKQVANDVFKAAIEREKKLGGSLKEWGFSNMEEAISTVNTARRDQKAREDLWPILFPEDKAKIAVFSSYVKRFDKAKDWDDYESIMEGVKESIKSKSARRQHIPASSRTGSGDINLDKLSPDEKIAYGLAHLKK